MSRIGPTPPPHQKLSPLPRRPKVEPPDDQVSLSLSLPPPDPLPFRVSSAWLRRVALASSALVSLASPALATAAGLILQQGVAAPRPAERIQLEARLSKTDPDLLRWLEADGVTFGVVRPGLNFAELGVIPSDPLSTYQAQLPQLRIQADAAVGAVQPYEAGIRSLQRARAQAPTQAEKDRLDQQLLLTQKEKRQALLEALPADSPLTTYTIPSLAGQLRDRDGLHTLVRQQAMPKGTTLMAQLVGARNPQQIQEYTALMEAINGERLEQARAESLAQASPAQKALWAQDPGAIPIDHRAHNILVPDLAYVADGRGGAVRTTLQGASIAGAWADAQGKTLATLKDDRGSAINGQFFPDSRRILVQSSKLSGGHTPVHELGHALEDAVARHDASFYRRWSARLEVAFQKAQQRGSISDYALTNPAEFVAEGVAHYFDQPEALKKADPDLFSLIEQLVAQARRLSQSPKIS